MPNVQRNGYGAFSLSLLVDGDCRVINDANPRNYAARRIFYAFDAGTFAADAGNVDANAAAEF